MDRLLYSFKEAYAHRDGYSLAAVISPEAPKNDAGQLHAFHRSSNSFAIQNDLRSGLIYHNDIHLSKGEANAWIDVLSAYWSALGDLLSAEEALNQGKAREVDWTKSYQAWKDVVNSIIRGYNISVFPAWTVPCLYVAGKYLRNLAIKADESTRQKSGNVVYNEGFQDDIVGALGKNENLQDAVRQINRIFSLCISDRAPIDESRKWGLYYITNLLFKIYFRLGNINLSKNLLKSLHASATDMPPLEKFPKSHQVTFNYYAGVISFLEEDYAKAEEYLLDAWKTCHSNSPKNRELILTYLIPCHILTTHKLPTLAFLSDYPRLGELFLPLASAIKRASLSGFDAALAAGEPYFVKRRIYLTLERARDIALRNLLRKVFILGGYEPAKDDQAESERVRRTRIPIEEFVAAIRLSSGPGSGAVLDRDEVECMLANMIYKNMMKGYIHRERGIVVLSKGAAFPGTGV